MRPSPLIGPGTGLGVSALIPTQSGVVPISGEGEHVTMPPANARESAVFHLMCKRCDHVSAERVLSGPGLVNLYATLCELSAVPAASFMPAQITSMIRWRILAFSVPSLRVRSWAILATRTELGNSPGDGHCRDGKGIRDHRGAAGHERKRRGGRSLERRPHDQGREEGGEKKKDYYLSERRYGSFERMQIPKGVDADKIEATFKKGVLTVTLPKTPQAQKPEKKISVKAA
jgi:hypothetical protein